MDAIIDAATGARCFQTMVPMRDGTRLNTFVFLPAEADEKAGGPRYPVILQFVRFLRDAASGDFGVSYRFGVPVGRLLMERFPATLELSLCAMLVATVLGIPLGVWTALQAQFTAMEVALSKLKSQSDWLTG